MIKLVIFDLDGVLVDALPLHEKALLRAIKEITDITIINEEHKKYAHRPTLVKLKMMVDDGIFNEKLIEKISKRKQQLTISLISKEIIPLFNVIDTIRFLKKYGVVIGCASNCIRKTLVSVLKTIGIIKDFDILISNEDVKHGKPSPEMYLKIMDNFGFNGEETLIVEDSDVGIKAAIAAKAFVLEVFHPYILNIELLKNRLNNIEKYWRVK
jgi:HAD superfamily hydrolase (TIGR01509 family)